MAKKNWIQGAIKHPGSLKKTLGVPADEPIPKKKLLAAAAGKHVSAATQKKAQLALTLSKFKKK